MTCYFLNTLSHLRDFFFYIPTQSLENKFFSQPARSFHFFQSSLPVDLGGLLGRSGRVATKRWAGWAKFPKNYLFVVQCAAQALQIHLSARPHTFVSFWFLRVSLLNNPKFNKFSLKNISIKKSNFLDFLTKLVEKWINLVSGTWPCPRH